jgi:hypothetical protein
MTENANIKILVAYHRPEALWKSDILVPIHAGRAVADQSFSTYFGSNKLSAAEMNWMKKNMAGDDTGDNISGMNRSFAEMTAIYWAWKNYESLGNPDYIGLMHYSRLFELLGKTTGMPTISDLGLDHATLSQTLEKHGMIAPEIGYQSKTIDRQFFTGLRDGYLKGTKLWVAESTKMFYKNMFVMPREHFFDYCETVFGLLFRLCADQEKICSRPISTQLFDDNRSMGFLAEWLTSYYLQYLISEKVPDPFYCGIATLDNPPNENIRLNSEKIAVFKQDMNRGMILCRDALNLGKLRWKYACSRAAAHLLHSEKLHAAKLEYRRQIRDVEKFLAIES